MTTALLVTLAFVAVCWLASRAFAALIDWCGREAAKSTAPNPFTAQMIAELDAIEARKAALAERRTREEQRRSIDPCPEVTTREQITDWLRDSPHTFGAAMKRPHREWSPEVWSYPNGTERPIIFVVRWGEA